MLSFLQTHTHTHSLPLNTIRLLLVSSKQGKHNYGFVTPLYFLCLDLSSELRTDLLIEWVS